MVDERIAVLEIKVETLEAQNKTILEKLDAISAQFSRQKGFMGGIIFVVTCLFSAATLGISYLTGR
jgi:hypothetical protein